MKRQETIIITSLEKEEAIAKINDGDERTPIYTLKAATSNHSFPCTWVEILSIFQKYKRVILFHIDSANDKLLQGTRQHVFELTLLLFQKAAEKCATELLYYHEQKLISMEAIWSQPPLNDTAKSKFIHTKETVTSIQKTKIKKVLPASKWIEIYFSWLERFTLKLIKIRKTNDTYSFYVHGLKKPLLVLEKNSELKEADMIELRITGGFLNKERNEVYPTGRFWFVTSSANSLYTALVHFRPSLPWHVYRVSQGPIHQVVMFFFSKHVQKIT